MAGISTPSSGASADNGGMTTDDEYTTADGHKVTIRKSDHDDEAFPFTTPAGSEARMFIQWKGTDVCIDFYCPCGDGGHFDGMFAYALKCPSCGAVWEMGTQVIARRNDNFDGATQELE